MDFIEKVISDFPSLAKWKLQLWRKISNDARTKGAFPDRHFDNAGMLKPYAREYHRLYDWLAGVDDGARFDTFEPAWEYRNRGDWELYFIDTEEWLHVRATNEDEAIALKPAVKRKLGKGGMVVAGLTPNNGIANDIDTIDELGPVVGAEAK